MSTAAVTNLRLALAQILQAMDGLPPFSEARRELHRDVEALRVLVARLERRAAA